MRSENIIDLIGIGQTYDGKKWIIKDLNFSVKDSPNEGQFVLLLGASGCGKSTLLRYIAGLQTPTEGDVLVYGVPRTEDLAVSMVFQQYPSMPCYTVLDNVILPLKYRGVKHKECVERGMEMLRQVGLSGHELKFAKSPGLSGGQLQRVAIARALITNPEIILMDEPFGALDTRTRLDMQLLVLDIWEQTQSTIIFVTHDISEAVFLGREIHIMQANPGRIAKSFRINLEGKRDRALKSTQAFMDMVNVVDGALMDISRS